MLYGMDGDGYDGNGYGGGVMMWWCMLVSNIYSFEELLVIYFH